MEATEIIAERQLLFVSPEGQEILSSIQFGAPYFRESHGYCCDCEVPNIERRPYGAGVDGIQVMLLAMGLVESQLKAKCSKGWRILWPDTRTPTSPREIFEAEHFLILRDET